MLVNDIAWFFGAKASIEGGMTVTRCRLEPLPGERLAREHVRVGRATWGEEAPRLARDVVREIEADVGAPDERDVDAAASAGIMPAVCGSWRITTSSGRTSRASAAALISQRRSYAARSASPAARRRRRSRGAGCGAAS